MTWTPTPTERAAIIAWLESMRAATPMAHVTDVIFNMLVGSVPKPAEPLRVLRRVELTATKYASFVDGSYALYDRDSDGKSTHSYTSVEQLAYNWLLPRDNGATFRALESLRDDPWEAPKYVPSANTMGFSVENAEEGRSESWTIHGGPGALAGCFRAARQFQSQQGGDLVELLRGQTVPREETK